MMDIPVGWIWVGFMRGNVPLMTICECIRRSTLDLIWPFLSPYVLALGGSYETLGSTMTAARA